MNEKALIAHALGVASALPAASQGQPFGEDTEVFKVVGKVFAIISTREGRGCVTLKCAPPHAEALVAKHESIIPGYHMNKKHWISIIPSRDPDLDPDFDETLVEDLIGNSYDIVVSLLPRAERPSAAV